MPWSSFHPVWPDNETEFSLSSNGPGTDWFLSPRVTCLHSFPKPTLPSSANSRPSTPPSKSIAKLATASQHSLQKPTTPPSTKSIPSPPFCKPTGRSPTTSTQSKLPNTPSWVTPWALATTLLSPFGSATTRRHCTAGAWRIFTSRDRFRLWPRGRFAGLFTT